MERVKLKPKTHLRKTSSNDVQTRKPFLLGPPPILEGERLDEYEGLVARVSAAVNPRDVIEEILIQDLVDLSWEALRLRRLKSALLAASAWEGLRIVLEPLVDHDNIDELAERWARREPDAVAQIKDILASANLTMDAVIGQALCQQLTFIESIERLIAMAETRRNNALREIECHRAAFGLTLRRVIEIENAGKAAANDSSTEPGVKNDQPIKS